MSNDKRVTPYERVKLARDKDRPGIEDYLEALFDGFMEFHGDRLFRALRSSGVSLSAAS